MAKLQKPIGTEATPAETTEKKTPQQILLGLLPIFALNKREADSYKKLADKQSTEIKGIMIDNTIDEFTDENGNRVTCTKSEKQTFNNELLLAKAKELKIKGLVKKTEYVDMDVLESAIYNGKINPVDLAPCQETSTSYTLRLTPAKK